MQLYILTSFCCGALLTVCDVINSRRVTLNLTYNLSILLFELRAHVELYSKGITEHDGVELICRKVANDITVSFVTNYHQ